MTSDLPFTRRLAGSRRRPACLLSAALLAALWTAAPAARGAGSAPPTFHSIGPAGGSVTDLAAGSDGIVYAGAEHGALFRRPSPPARWQSIARDAVRFGVGAVSVDPFDPAVLYAGAGNRLYRSADRGDTWTELPLELPPQRSIRALAADPLTRDRIYVGTLESLHASDDAGQTWVSRPGSVDTHLLADPSVPDRAFSLAVSGLLRTENGGDSWEEVATTGGPVLRALAFLPATAEEPEALYIAWRENGAHVLFRSLNGGADWDRVSGLPVQPEVLAADPFDPEHLLLGSAGGEVWTSDDRGLTWTRSQGLAADGRSVIDLAADPTRPGVVYAGRSRDGGTHLSTDGGATWRWSEAGFRASDTTLAGFDPETARFYADVAGHGPHVRAVGSPDTGADGWRPLAGPFAPRYAHLLGVHPHRPRELFTAVWEPGAPAFYRSRNRGRSWEPIPTGGDYPGGGPEKLWFHPTLPDRLYVWEQVDGEGLYRSDDGGETFLFLMERGRHLAIAPDRPDLLYSAGTTSDSPTDPSYAYGERSFDGGLTWEPFPSIPAGETGGPVWTHPLTGDVFLRVDRTLYRSRDRAATWQALPEVRTGGPVTLAFHPTDPKTLLVGTAPGLYRSTDGGAAWSFFDHGLTSPLFLSLDIFPALPYTVYAGTEGGGVQRIDLPPPSGKGPDICPDGPARHLCYRNLPFPGRP